MRKINKIIQTSPNRTKDGLTLIELIVALALASIVSLAVFSLFQINMKTFNLGISNGQNQNQINLASQFITKQLRFSKNVALVRKKPNTFSTDPTVLFNNSFNYIYIDNNIIKYRTGTTTTSLFNVSDFTLNFRITPTSEKSNKIISFTIGKRGNFKFDLSTAVTCMNKDNNSINVYEEDGTVDPNNYMNYNNSIDCVMYKNP